MDMEMHAEREKTKRIGKSNGGSEFERLAATDLRESFVLEVVGFLRNNKKWWLLPIMLLCLLLGLAAMLPTSVAAPFIYALF